MRKTTTKLLAVSLAMVAFATPLCVWAGSQDGVLSMLLGAASLGDDGGRSSTKAADDLVHEARQAMQSGDLDTAAAKIEQAEALQPKYPPLHLGDSPKKARATLEKMRAQKQLPSQRAKPYEGAKSLSKAAPQDPFMARDSQASAGDLPATMPPLTSPADQMQAGLPRSNLPPQAPSQPQLLQAPAPPAQPLPRADLNPALSGNRYASALQASGESLTADATPTPYFNGPSIGGAPSAAQPNVVVPENSNLPTARSPAANQPSLLPPTGSPYRAMPMGDVPNGDSDKARALELTKQARSALQRGDVATAEQFARQAMPLAPETAYGPQDDRPGLVLLEVQKTKRAGLNAPMAGSTPASSGPAGNRYAGTQALYVPDRDASRNTQAVVNGETGAAPPPGVYLRQGPQAPNQPSGVRLAQGVEPALQSGSDLPVPMDPTEPTPEAGTGEGLKWYRQGVEALSQGQADQALQAFRRAYAFQGELDVVTRQRLQDHLQVLGAPVEPAPAPATVPQPIAGNAPAAGGGTRQLFAEVSRQQSAARDMREKQPKQALELLQRTKDTVASAGDVDQAAREQLIRRLDASMNEIQQYITQNAPQIELDEQNRQVEDSNKRAQQQKVEVEAKIAYMVNDFNKLVDEGRFSEAQVLAKRAAELAPENPLAVQLPIMARMLERNARNNQIISDKENGVIGALREVDESSIPFVGEYQMPNVKDWETHRRSKFRQKLEGRFRKTPRDMEIEQRLTTPVPLKVQDRPLSEVMAYLGKIAGVPVYLDPEGMKAEGVTSDTPVTIDLTDDISLKSALRLILTPLHLTFIVKDEVLKITTEDESRGQLYEVVYPVGDLVIPIPNFAPNGREGINAAFREAYERTGWAGATGGGFGGGAARPYMADYPSGTGAGNKNVMAQIGPLGGIMPIGGGGAPQSGVPQSVPFGPGGAGGGSQANFDPLIDLISGTIATQTWSELGGPGTIEGFQTTLSLVVSQTQEVHDEIADLLTQLRRLQDLQVTIEVRFITLQDDFFERIGFDFDFNIASNSDTLPTPTQVGPPPSYNPGISPSRVVGLDPAGQVTTGQDIQFRQNSFATALPQFGGFDPATAATFGFAILSDIEAYFLVTAAQGDNRSNILQAPKVTLFNGQQATVSDQTQRPFVISVTPVVGDFAVGQQPVIVVLSEGTSLTVQAVVSENRRFVRLTIVPFFSQIGDVEEFTFSGTKTTKKASSEDKTGDDTTSTTDDTETSTSGTTVQLPEFSFVSVTTTVSVPDGGTVLLGGIKRLSEGRIERGVPILSKMPYINRLFRNVGIGRSTSSLMMMVTPRIIIQEEEEENLLGTAPAP